MVPFLRDLGVMTADGKIVHAKFDKFRQINRFLEFVEDVLPQLPKDREVTILDFGCGKSYLTFAMYYYLHELKKYDVCMIGLDLKTDVIRHCNELSEKYGYEKLKFLEGNIADYTGASEVDMVVTLHACDTATDFALEKAVGWNAKVILSVPCCQHEVNRQIASDTLKPVLKYGLLKERFAAIVTDGLRAEYLESVGYDVQILEFIDTYRKVYDFAEIVPASALRAQNLDTVLDMIFKYLPYGPQFYDEDTITDQPERAIVAEIIREKALHALDDEIPHGIAVCIDRMKQRKGQNIMDIEATIVCERDSHKGIVIGKGGAMLKKIGSNARYEIERLLEEQVNLKLWVKVKKDWRDSDFMIKNFGYDKKEI